MALTLPDHLLVMLLGVVLPIYGRWGYKRLLDHVAKKPGARATEYRHTAGWQWCLFAVVTVLWIWTGRAPELLGVRAPRGVGFWIGLGVCVAIAGFFVRQLLITRQRIDLREQVRTAFSSVAPLLPHTKNERRWFSFLSFTAGIVEELAYRGFLVWYFDQLTNLWLAVALSSLVFGIAHFYQGVGGILKTGAAGLVLALLYVWTGSIWVPMLMHWLVDDVQGRTAFEAFKEDGAPIESAA